MTNILSIEGVFPYPFIALIFAILVIPLFIAIQKMAIFNGKTNIVMAICVCLLCIIGMLELLPSTQPAHMAESSKDYHKLDFLLLPYAALGITLLLIMLLAFITWLIRKIKAPIDFNKNSVNHITIRIMKPNILTNMVKKIHQDVLSRRT